MGNFTLIVLEPGGWLQHFQRPRSVFRESVLTPRRLRGRDKTLRCEDTGLAGGDDCNKYC